MIEYALLFGLGFLSATLIAILIAPAIHRRIVAYTEGRIRATLPISPEEVRAQRDMARAVYAAENARTSQELIQERDRTAGLLVRVEGLVDGQRTLEGQKLDLSMHIDTLDAQAAELRARLRLADSEIQALKAALDLATSDGTMRDSEISELHDRLQRFSADADAMRLDASGREAELDNLRTRMGNLRDERETHREEARRHLTRVKEAEARLAREMERAAGLEERLARAVADHADKSEALERRGEEILRLRESLGGADASGPTASRGGRNPTASEAAVARVSAARRKMKAPGAAANELVIASAEADEAVAGPSTVVMPADDASASDSAAPEATADDVAAMAAVPVGNAATGAVVAKTDAGKAGSGSEIDMSPAVTAVQDDIRNRAAALIERLSRGRERGNEAAMREELAVIAANLVAVTMVREGPSSPIRAVLAGKVAHGTRLSLAERSKQAIGKLGGPGGQ